MRVPKSYKQITVGQFQETLPYYIKAVEEKDSVKALDHWAIVIAILTNSQLDEVESLPINELKTVIKKLSWLSDNQFYGSKKHYLLFKGRLYHAPKDAKKFNSSRYIEYKTFLGRGGLIPEIHNLLATIYQPVFGKQSHEERANLFKSIKLGRVYPTVFFYTNRYNKSISLIREYGIRIADTKLKEAQEILMQTLRETLDDIGAGMQPSTK